MQTPTWFNREYNVKCNNSWCYIDQLINQELICFHTCLSTWEEYRRREMSECTPHISLFLSFTNTRIVSWIHFLLVAVITMWRNCRQQTKMIGAQWGSSTETLETCQHQPYEKVRLVLTCVDRELYILDQSCPENVIAPSYQAHCGW